jgi:hypothetical protein
MTDFDTEQRLEYLERELKSVSEYVAELQAELRGAQEWLATAQPLAAGTKVTNVLAAHGYAINALLGRVEALERSNERGIPLG